MQIVSSGDIFHEMSNAVFFLGKKQKQKKKQTKKLSLVKRL